MTDPRNELLATGQFLLDRLGEYEPDFHDHARDYYGHVEPAIARFKAAIARTADGPEPVAWAYYHDGQMDDPHHPIFTTSRWRTCVEPWTERALYTHPVPDGPAFPQGISKETQDALDAVDANIRSAAANARDILVGGPAPAVSEVEQAPSAHAAEQLIARLKSTPGSEG